VFKWRLGANDSGSPVWRCLNNAIKETSIGRQKDYKVCKYLNNMQLKRKLIYSGIISATTLIASIFIPIIPCRIAPNIPSPIYSWTLCSLNPDKVKTMGHIVEYLGYTASLTQTYILTLLISFAVSITILHFFARRRR